MANRYVCQKFCSKKICEKIRRDRADIFKSASLKFCFVLQKSEGNREDPRALNFFKTKHNKNCMKEFMPTKVRKKQGKTDTLKRTYPTP